MSISVAVIALSAGDVGARGDARVLAVGGPSDALSAACVAFNGKPWRRSNWTELRYQLLR